MPDPIEIIVQRMIDADEDEDTIRQVIADDFKRKNPGKAIISGGIEGLVEGAISTVAAPFKVGYGVVADAHQMATEGGVPRHAQALLDGLGDAGNVVMEGNPEERARLAGNIVGGAGLMRYAPMAPRPIARGTGSLMRTVGKKGEWPIRMVGAHMLGERNPVGAGVIALPELLQRGGNALKDWGTQSTVRVAPGTERLGIPAHTLPISLGRRAGVRQTGTPTLTPADQTKAFNTIRTSLEKSKVGTEVPGAAGLRDLDAAIKQEQRAAAATRRTSQRQEDQLYAAETRADMNQLRQDLKQPQTKDATGATVSQPQTFADGPANFSGLSDVEIAQRMLRTNPGAVGVRPRAAQAPPPQQSRRDSPFDGPEWRPKRTDEVVAPGRETQVDVESGKTYVKERRATPRSTAVRFGAEMSDADYVKMRNKVDGEPPTVAINPATMGQMPEGPSIASSKSKNIAAELSTNDMADFARLSRENPTWTMEQLVIELEANRAIRHTKTHPDNALLDKQYRNSLGNDEPYR